MAETKKKTIEEWQPYELDRHAEELVRKYRDKKNVLNESHKMRMTVAYGLERFWGEHLRLKPKPKPEDKYSEKEKIDFNKASYWQDVWNALGEIFEPTNIKIPGLNMTSTETKDIKAVVDDLWKMDISDRRIVLMVLTQLCDALVWWTQRYKIKENND
ncbi:hypothetical protein C7B64_17110 [Merismopedia glauca CCAP 1448/3]|uniref:CRISPR type III-B/RAMP module-associated protein Cmr5 n=2 Tax=Merismopedia TaxID=53402 RepID=A0A2T1C062_9CYAN|nr:hypothetical protein C7B64_17110 [Merismopedia glauca CCAP 1448/3]